MRRTHDQHLTDIKISRTAWYRARTEAARHWRAGHPHRAYEALCDHGCEVMWPEFRRGALLLARARYQSAISYYARD
jgi:hypothetical protein